MFKTLAFIVLLLGGVSEEEVGQRVRELSHPSVVTRNAAEQALIQMGPEALPFLPAASPSAEARLRLSRIRIQLEKQKSADSLEAGRIVLSQKATLNEVLSEIQKQTHNEIFTTTDGSILLEPTEGSGLSFWEYVDRVCDAHRLTLQSRGREAAWYFVPSRRATPRHADKNPLAAYMGPFRLEATKITSSTLLENRVTSTQIQLDLGWEPRIRPIFGQLTLVGASFVKSSGETQDATSALQKRIHEIPFGAKEIRASMDIPVPLTPAATESMRAYDFLSLRGHFSAVAASETIDFKFESLDQKLNREFSPVSHRTAALLTTLSSLRSEKIAAPDGSVKEYLIAGLRYRYENSYDAMESHRTWIYENNASLVCATTSERLESERSELLRQTSNEIAAEIYIPIPPSFHENVRDWTLIFPRPGGLYQVEYEFEIKGVPIP
ncbi:MAG: hypothetical protein Q4D38_04690 [Planctomycetia bacterium]|nr:hypothetical protein [Planctomycetia bacterium]